MKVYVIMDEKKKTVVSGSKGHYKLRSLEDEKPRAKILCYPTEKMAKYRLSHFLTVRVTKDIRDYLMVNYGIAETLYWVPRKLLQVVEVELRIN
jgi:hypothetical protein